LARPHEPGYLSRHDRRPHPQGLALLARLSGTENPGILQALEAVAPDLAQFTVRFAYGEVYARPDLDLRQRQLTTVATLAAMGGLEPQLEFHAEGALNVGCTPTQLVETMIHLVVYAGFPRALNGIGVLRKVFARRSIAAQPPAAESMPTSTRADMRAAPHTPAPMRTTSPEARREAGLAWLRRVDGELGEHVIASLDDIAPDLGRFIVDFAFGEIYPRAGLDLFARELVTVAVLTALGAAAPQLRVHMHGLLNVGGTREQLVGIVTQVAVYAGFPRAINAATTAREVLAAHVPRAA